MSQPRVIVFARYPEPGAAKTRLIPALGEQGAADLYRRLLERTLDAVRVSGLPFEMRVTGAAPSQFRKEFGNDIPVLEQGEGDLGERLARIHGPALVIGSDCPGLTGEHLKRASEALSRSKVVLGPACDGGYWLIGFRDRMPWLLSAMPWSTDRVLPETLSRLQARGIEPAMLPELSDIDEPDDLAGWPELLA